VIGLRLTGRQNGVPPSKPVMPGLPPATTDKEGDSTGLKLALSTCSGRRRFDPPGHQLQE
jgi:hypothetical protein